MSNVDEHFIFDGASSIDDLKRYADGLSLLLTTQNVKAVIQKCLQSKDSKSSQIALFPACTSILVNKNVGYLVLYMTQDGMLDWKILVEPSAVEELTPYNALWRSGLGDSLWTSAQFADVCERAGLARYKVVQASALRTFSNQLEALFLFHILDDAETLRRYNEAVVDIDLPYIDDVTLRLQLPSIVADIRESLESLGVPVSSTQPAKQTATVGTTGTPVEKSTKEDLCKRMKKGEGVFNWDSPWDGYISGFIVEIVYDYSAHKLRARTNDGVNGIGWVAFPNDLRKQDAVYFVQKGALTFNGKNYRVTQNTKISLIP